MQAIILVLPQRNSYDLMVDEFFRLSNFSIIRLRILSVCISCWLFFLEISLKPSSAFITGYHGNRFTRV